MGILRVSLCRLGIWLCMQLGSKACSSVCAFFNFSEHHVCFSCRVTKYSIFAFDVVTIKNELSAINISTTFLAVFDEEEGDKVKQQRAQHCAIP